ncbi:Exopolyphosphatase [Lignipirellula cremea]|uniref:Exopolyphosphatase n=2 Tax=Lignipirellula cremea TaxID=2528010 RepID=A0A518DQZ2_9BACT|nr:Exopolyphosphatase [Lignipirellula cremea]
MAVIDIGATSIRMAVGEINAQGDVRVIDTLSQAVSLGKDVFTRGQINKSTIEDCVRVLKIYRHKLREYQISGSDRIRVVATSAVREASNRLSLIDRVYIATGLEVEPLDEAEVTRLTFLGVQPHLVSDNRFADAQTLVVEVGGGSTEVLLIRDLNVAFSYTYRLGSMRLRRTLEAYRAPAMKVREIMENQIARTVNQIRRRVASDAPSQMIALGGDVRFAVAELLPDWDRHELATIDVAALRELTDDLLNSHVDELVQQRHLNFPDAETVGPALLTYVELAEALGLKQLHVSNVNLRDGLLEEIALGQTWTEEFRHQIIRSALDVAEKYSCDRAHAVQVAELSRSLFRELADEHQLDPRYEMLLYTAALLHEAGLFISNRAYHKHSMYVIRNSEIFGLGKSELLLVALTARYHRRASPQPTHEGYAMLERDRRVAIAKMAALLRIAVSLDESRTQRINQISCSRRKDQLVISVHGVDDMSLELLALRQSGTLFEEVFGLKPVLRSVS